METRLTENCDGDIEGDIEAERERVRVERNCSETHLCSCENEILSRFYSGGHLQLYTTIMRLHGAREHEKSRNEENRKKECNFAREKTHYDAILIKITFIAYQADVHACHCAAMLLSDVFMRRQNILEKLCRIDNRLQWLGHRASRGESCGRLHLSSVTSGNCNVSVLLSVVELTTSNHFFFLSVLNESILVGSSE